MPTWPTTGAHVAEFAPTEETPTPTPEETPAVAADLSSGSEPAAELQGPDASATPSAVDAAPDAPTEEAPEPSRVRTLADVYDDIRNDRPVAPSELREVQRREAVERQRIETERAEQERITNLLPSKRNALIQELAEFSGITDLNSTEGLALQYKFDKHWTELDKDVRSSVSAPIVREFGRVMWDALGRTAEAAEAIRQLPADPKALIPLAIDIGRRMGMTAPDVADTEAVTKWVEGGKLDSKKLVTAADAEKRVQRALDIERRARGEVAAPGPTGANSSTPSARYTLAQIEAMPQREWMALGDHEVRARILNDAHLMAGH